MRIGKSPVASRAAGPGAAENLAAIFLLQNFLQLV
jgi:hypothetical protein